jgi:ADP-heptose:LPS heptosyltransferase
MASRLPIPLTAHILVVRALPGLGDLLCSVPMMQSLRQAFPRAHITWLGLPGTEWFKQRFAHLLDGWLPFPGFPGIPEGWQRPQATVDFLQWIQQQPYDLVLQIHGNGSAINPFITLLGGRRQAGFYLPGQYCPDPRYFLPYPQQISEVARLLQLTQFLGCPRVSQNLEFPLQDDEYRKGLQLLTAHSLEAGQYICLHPGASSADRRWSINGFTQVTQQLVKQGYRIVLTGTAAERPLTRQICAAINPLNTVAPLNLTGQTSLAELAVLLRHSALLICNDTGISHLAAALKTPSVVIFSNSEVIRWAPTNRNRHRIVDSRQEPDRTLAAVISQAKLLLDATPPQTPAMAEVCHVS